VSDKYLGKDFKLNNWNLNALTVAEEHRRKGVARMLIKVGEDQVR
jgi:predicted N-acetyltransferase YhbS